MIALAALWLSSAANVLALGAGLFAMRVLGQGLLSHLAMTTVAKWFDAARGRAPWDRHAGVSDWRGHAPSCRRERYGHLRLARGMAWGRSVCRIRARSCHRFCSLRAPSAPRIQLTAKQRAPGASNHRLGPGADALQDWRFYALAPGILAAPFLVTSVLFHHAYLVETKGWTLGAFSTLFML